MDNQTQILAIRQNAKAELMNLKTIEDGMIHLNKLKGIEAWVKAQKLDAELQVLVKEQELRAKRVIGVLLNEGRENGEIASVSDNQSTVHTHGKHRKKTLNDLGLSDRQSHQFTKLASIPEQVFEEHIAEAKAEVDTALNKLTTTGAVKLAEQLRGDKSGLKTAAKINEKMEYERQVSILIKEVNALPKQYRDKIKDGIR